LSVQHEVHEGTKKDGLTSRRHRRAGQRPAGVTGIDAGDKLDP
jgi:hypothetical protein